MLMPTSATLLLASLSANSIVCVWIIPNICAFVAWTQTDMVKQLPDTWTHNIFRCLRMFKKKTKKKKPPQSCCFFAPTKDIFNSECRAEPLPSLSWSSPCSSSQPVLHPLIVCACRRSMARCAPTHSQKQQTRINPPRASPHVFPPLPHTRAHTHADLS